MPIPTPRIAFESPYPMGEWESRAFIVDVSIWGASSPSSPTNVLLSADGKKDLSLTHLTGSPSINGTVFTSSLVSGLKKDVRYILQGRFVEEGQNWSFNCELVGEI